MVELLRDPALLVLFLVGVRPVGRKHRVEREGDEQRDGDRAGDREREWLEPLPADAGHEADGHEYGENGERRRGYGEADFGGAVARRGVVVFPHLYVTHDVLAHHDGIVDENTDG